MIVTPQYVMSVAQDVSPSIEPALIAAICDVESSFDPLAVRFEPYYRWLHNESLLRSRVADLVSFGFLGHLPGHSFEESRYQRSSIGLMQVMGATARDLGYVGYLPDLVDPKLNITYGAKYLKILLSRYGRLEDAVSAYNAGYPTWHEKDGNRYYVKKVIHAMKRYKEGHYDGQ